MSSVANVSWKKQVFDRFSESAVRKAVAEDGSLFPFWQKSLQTLPDLREHYASLVVDTEAELRIRLLVCAQAAYMKRVFETVDRNKKDKTVWVDVGDSDGSARMLFNQVCKIDGLETIGVNFEQEAVDLMTRNGLKALRMNAMDLRKNGVDCDLMSVFETLEHLPDPLGFLEKIRDAVDQKLVISVPLVTSSRVSLGYLSRPWPKGRTPSYCDNHVFELCPKDWGKLFAHAGWKVEHDWEVRQFPRNGVLSLIMKQAWRHISFEGYYFVCLQKDDSNLNRFRRD